jgi:nicotinate-nucleotide--dimethylbenzimidazole phosphoribosyltransferase
VPVWEPEDVLRTPRRSRASRAAKADPVPEAVAPEAVAADAVTPEAPAGEPEALAPDPAATATPAAVTEPTAATTIPPDISDKTEKLDAPTLVTTEPVESPKHAAPPAARTNKALAVTFAILAVLFLAGTGVMTALYVNQTNAYAKEAKVAGERSEQIAAAQAELAQAKTQLQTATTANTALQTQLNTAQSQLVQAQSEKATISKCLDDLHKFFIAADANASDATLTSLYNTAQLSCDEANKFLN